MWDVAAKSYLHHVKKCAILFVMLPIITCDVVKVYEALL